MNDQTLGLSGVSNARQLGGYPAADGRRVRHGVLLRSGALFDALEEDLAKLTGQYGLCTVIDLRTASEAAGQPDPALEGVEYIRIPVMEEAQGAGSQAAIVEIYRIYGDDPGRAYVEMIRSGALADDMYACFFDSEYSMKAYRQFFDVLLEHEAGAVLWHCTGGKDRAGLAAVLVLGLLGVDEETILADFALTNEMLQKNIDAVAARAAAYSDDAGEIAQVKALVGVSVSHMRRVLDRAREECGSLAAFIQQKLGLTDAEVRALRDKFLE